VSETVRARDTLLVALTFSSGAVDAISFIALGKVFTAFMTGNFVFLGLRAAGAPGPEVLTVVISIAAFALGVFAAIRIVGSSSRSRPWPREVTVALGVVVFAQAAFAAGWIAVSGDPSAGMTDLLVGISALAMGVQSGAVLSLAVKGVLTTAATATLMYLVSELAAASSVVERARHAAVVIALLAGATAGGVLLEHARTFAPLLPLVVTVLVVAIAYDPLSAREPAVERDSGAEFDFRRRAGARGNGRRELPGSRDRTVAS
jgi:uncharacterized membrane protein YoaK (UPF0700 family)